VTWRSEEQHFWEELRDLYINHLELLIPARFEPRTHPAKALRSFVWAVLGTARSRCQYFRASDICHLMWNFLIAQIQNLIDYRNYHQQTQFTYLLKSVWAFLKLWNMIMKLNTRYIYFMNQAGNSSMARFRFPAKEETFSSPPRVDRLWDPPSLLSNDTGNYSPGNKTPGAWTSPPSNTRSCTFTSSPYIFIAWRLIN